MSKSKPSKDRPQKRAKVEVRKSRAGLGLFAVEPIKKRKFIIQYRGKFLNNEQADRRGGKYLFEVNSRWTIDGTPRWNTARYINHSCRPNAEALVVGKKVKIYSKKPIKAGEEINYYYGRIYFNDFIGKKNCRCDHCRKERLKRRKRAKSAKV